MDFEQILPFILLLIMWGAGRILNKMGKTEQKKQAPADRKPILVKILQQLAAFKEKSNNEEFGENFESPSQAPAEEREKESLTEKAKDSLPQESTITSRETVSVSPPIKVVQPSHTILCKKNLATINRRKLKNAVIWAEILAPPVALRDQ